MSDNISRFLIPALAALGGATCVSVALRLWNSSSKTSKSVTEKVSRISREAILHLQTPPYQYAYDKNTLHLVLRAKKGDLVSATVIHIDTWAYLREKDELELANSDYLFDYWTVAVKPKTLRCEYIFQLNGKNNETLYYTESGFNETEPDGRIVRCQYFCHPYICEIDLYKPPNWVQETVWYQIFIDRFHNGDTKLDPPGTLPWASAPPSKDNFFGGDLQGIIDKVDYFKDLGINGLYLTPIFTAPSNHKYDTRDFFDVDPQFGTKDTFKTLVDTMHKNGIKVMLDCVFNHSGNLFGQWMDVKTHGEKSKYKDWFHIKSFPIKTDPPNYIVFGNFASMPKFNTSNPEVVKYLISVAVYWIKEFDVDGWRLDVANEIDKAFWRKFSKELRKVKPDCFILGEAWHNSLPWINKTKWDSVMHYPLMWRCEDLLVDDMPPSRFVNDIVNVLYWYPRTVHPALFNILSSQDTNRVLTRCHNNLQSFLLSVLIQFTHPGTPCIFYGDEVGLDGENDPGCRKCMEWNPDKQNRTILDFHKTMIKIKKSNRAMIDGDFKFLEANDAEKYLVYKRFTKEETIVIIINLNYKIITINLDKIVNSRRGLDLIIQENIDLKTLVVKSREGRIIKLRN